jgi:catalase
MQVTDEDFVQPAALWEVLGRTPGQQDNFVRNVAGHLCGARESTRKRTYEMFYKVNKKLGAIIEGETEKLAPRLLN